MAWLFDSPENAQAALAALAAVGALTIAATSASWRRIRNRRRDSRIARAGSVEEWEAARRQPVREEKRVPWLSLVGNGAFGCAGAAVMLLADDVKTAFVGFALVGLSGFAWDRWLKRSFPEMFEDDESDDYFGNSREPYIPSEATWGLVAALALVGLIVGAIAVFS